ncbi:hypothetical protein RND81_10G022500 [Saponaria officinalis]|uniref:Gnk2-homologous domain-containing protein n=1 Tax=Saponaria officinalis TaxID=3572 RepID=A0AAW1HYA4_SAPOF
MLTKKISMLIVLQIIVLSLLQVVSSREQIYFEGSICRKSDNVSSTGEYRDNILFVLEKLLNESSNTRFFNTSSGTGVDRVNGLFVCRPDLPLDVCTSCVNTALGLFNRVCSTKKQAIAWYQQCMVRYTNLTIFATYRTEPSSSYFGLFNVSTPDIFPAKLNKTLETIITKASMSDNKVRFASSSTNYTIFEGLHGMAWCTPDIKASECKDCLMNAMSLMPNDGLAQYANMFLPNCLIKYDTAPFIFPTEDAR